MGRCSGSSGDERKVRKGMHRPVGSRDGLMWDSWASRGYRCKHKVWSDFTANSPRQVVVVRCECCGTGVQKFWGLFSLLLVETMHLLRRKSRDQGRAFRAPEIPSKGQFVEMARKG